MLGDVLINEKLRSVSLSVVAVKSNLLYVF
jgi:hypothetical protein